MSEGWMDGGCPCGAVRYRVRRAPMFVNCCHCRQCQQQTGTAFALNAILESDQVTLLSGTLEGVKVPARSGIPQTIFHCTACKCALWSHYRDLAVMSFVRVGTLDEPDKAPPGAHIYTATKLPWVVLNPEIPAYEGRYDRDTLWPAESVERFWAVLGQSPPQKG